MVRGRQHCWAADNSRVARGTLPAAEAVERFPGAVGVEERFAAAAWAQSAAGAAEAVAVAEPLVAVAPPRAE